MARIYLEMLQIFTKVVSFIEDCFGRFILNGHGMQDMCIGGFGGYFLSVRASSISLAITSAAFSGSSASRMGLPTTI